MKNRKKREVTTILSDVGKIILDYDDESLVREVQKLFRNNSEERIRRVIFGDPDRPRSQDYLGACYARGEMDTSEFLRQLHRVLDLYFVPSEAWLYRAFTSSFRPIPKVVELWRGLRQGPGYKIIAVSNIEEICWRKVVEAHLDQLFNHHVLSYREGYLKPSKELLVRALELAGCDAVEAVFIDDKPENLVPARKLGIRVHCYRDYRGLVAFLKKNGVPLPE